MLALDLCQPQTCWKSMKKTWMVSDWSVVHYTVLKSKCWWWCAHLNCHFSFKKYNMFLCYHSLVKTEAKVWENLRADQWKPKMQSRIFTRSRILTNFAEVFTRLWGTENMFYFFYKIVFFRPNKEKDDIQSALCIS